jgi:hypothetical protein
MQRICFLAKVVAFVVLALGGLIALAQANGQMSLDDQMGLNSHADSIDQAKPEDVAQAAVQTANVASAAPVELVGDVARGEYLWLEEYGCTDCHGDEADKDEPIPAVSAVVRGFPDRSETMSFLSNITKQEMADIRAYLYSLDE